MCITQKKEFVLFVFFFFFVQKQQIVKQCPTEVTSQKKLMNSSLWSLYT